MPDPVAEAQELPADTVETLEKLEVIAGFVVILNAILDKNRRVARD